MALRAAMKLATLTPAEIDQATACALDGMLLADYLAPKAQIHFVGKRPGFLLRHHGMFSIYHEPGTGEERESTVRAGHGRGGLERTARRLDRCENRILCGR